MRRRGLKRFAIFRFIALRFAVVGSINTAVDLGLFAALTGLLAMQPDRANAISYASSMVTSFILNRGWTFEDVRGGIAEQITRLIVVSLASLLLSTMIVAGLSAVMPALVAKFLSLPIMFLWSYSMTRRFVFWWEG
ncbi:MAG TPA: GtrA family protein [Stellaceae bacterium]|jgi:putative flippase GtrA|nr:GtrA family protein [Stellaceae bacterium]